MKGIIVILTLAVFLFSFSAVGEDRRISGQLTPEDEAYLKTLFPGQAVFFDKVIVYIAKKGDTLPKIVEMFCYTNDNKEVERVARENGIKESEIRPGDYIKLPIEPWRQRRQSPPPNAPAPPSFSKVEETTKSPK
ncbi:hypothetical protein A3J77_01360 [Candidatus Wolfebacteria bacterium RBG_13_41_7]|uniref:LysM domain-containing protein n=1 Tax=Candidatus Wolfebacteria bacterium RBG_13_41_7 TaxID=1802554 RepID=A0A1F8DNB6_9BACT|nr:MAG: hypothetical protein A3J77_01360 [Candidatus Wolfebacteria bacterium RBG_13_41_7]